ncbi:MAG: chorismate mutase [Rhizobium altiplani]|jgi:chorismate mutase|uniref:chorismate mutase n=1 Tax=Rhizobium TaxID=379 RepID=UPI0003687D0A|nr:chorismate mutase [Rhizobium sp. 42MFCr.1]
MQNANAEAQLLAHRQTIDNIDAALVHILAERFRSTNEIGVLKAQFSLPAVDKEREERQHVRLKELSRSAGLDPTFIESLMKFIMGEVVKRHRAIAANHTGKP